jgi:hypothetical protein
VREPAGEITQILQRLHAGDPAALDQLFPLVYAGLRASAARALGREHGGHTLHATDLVHERPSPASAPSARASAPSSSTASSAARRSARSPNC